MRILSGCILLILLAAGCGGDRAPDGGVQGVTSDTIVLGSHNDLSGPLATHGVPLSRGARMRFKQANSEGGIHGRNIRFIVEDSAYQVPLAVKATNKLLNVDKIFAMVGAIGTPHNNAVMARMFERNVPNLFPATAAVSMYEPLHPLKFSYFVSYRDQVRAGLAFMVDKYDVKRVCLQAVANDYGQESVVGFELAVTELGLEPQYVGRHKGTETDFAGTVAGIKNAGCELLFLGPFIKDAILIYNSARDAGWDGPVISNHVGYADEISEAEGMDGFYAVAPFRLPDFQAETAADSWVGQWYQEYNELFGERPPGQAMAGWLAADLTVAALKAAGPELTTAGFVAALEDINQYEDPFGGATLSFSTTKHQGANYLNLYQVQQGKWQTVATELPY